MKKQFKILILLVLSVCMLSACDPYEKAIKYYDKQDYVRAAEYFKKLADEGNAEAMAWLGLCIDRDAAHVDSAREWYTNAIENGAIEWFIEKAEEGVPQIQAQLGYCYTNGIGVEKDENKGLHWTRQSAEKGNARGQFNLGGYFEEMNDVEKAVEYYTKSANQGFVYAQNNLGRIYEINFQDKKNAMFWYEKAANQGFAYAQHNLGRIYEFNFQDKAKAIYWYEKAANQGYSLSQSFLATLYLGSNDKNNDDQVFNLLWKAANAGEKSAYNNLGYCFATGKGTNKNIQEALVWFKKAADNGDMIACQNYAVNAYSIWSSLSYEQKSYAVQRLSKSLADGSELAERLKKYVDQIDSRLYTGSVPAYNKNDIRTYSLPENRYLATVNEYQTYLAQTGNSGFSYSPDVYYCWITEYERKKYPDIFKLANPFSPSMAVDLGLSVKWAPQNIGADSPEEMGERFAWGETAPKEDYTWITYKYCKGSYNTIIPIGSNIQGTKYDAATVNWGPAWRMPTVAEYNELINRCTFELIKRYDTCGLKVVGPNGNTLFFPFEGGYGSTFYNTSQIYHDPFHAHCWVFDISDSDYLINTFLRNEGNYVRAVLVE